MQITCRHCWVGLQCGSVHKMAGTEYSWLDLSSRYIFCFILSSFACLLRHNKDVWLVFASISHWSHSDHQEDAKMMCDCQIHWSQSFQRETGLSNATLMTIHACILRIRLLTDNLTGMQQLDHTDWFTHALAMSRTTHCVHVQVQWTDYTRTVLNYSGLFSTAMDGTTLVIANDVTIIDHGVKRSSQALCWYLTV